MYTAMPKPRNSAAITATTRIRLAPTPKRLATPAHTPPMMQSSALRRRGRWGRPGTFFAPFRSLSRDFFEEEVTFIIPQVWHYVAVGTIRVNPRLAMANFGLMRENPDCD